MHNDIAFDRRMKIARLRANLERAALKVEGAMRREGLTTISPDALALRMVTEVSRARPRSLIVPWHLDATTVDFVIERVAREFALEPVPEC
jgi:hypothetical protein